MGGIFSWRAAASAAALASAALLSSCAGDGYYLQAAAGQFQMMTHRENIAAAVADETTAPELKRQLELIQSLVAFAHDRLALPDNGSYETFVPLDRRYVTWNVVAAPATALDPVTWCFPVVGCVSYRGYFAEADADAFAATLEGQGLDVAVLGTRAYSTLGWFHDPVPSTILFDPDYDLAATIFHELTHQRVYIPDDTTFDESYAVAVERAGTELWLAEYGTAEQRAAYRRERGREEGFVNLLLGAQDQLRALYAQSLDEAAMLAGKAAIFDRLRADYARLKASWGGYAGYDGFFAQDLNNAKLALIASYNSRAIAFTQLLHDNGGDWDAFHAAVEALSLLPPDQRNAELDRLAAEAR